MGENGRGDPRPERMGLGYPWAPTPICKIFFFQTRKVFFFVVVNFKQINITNFANTNWVRE